MKKFALLAPAGALLIAAHAFAADSDADIEKFRTAYTAGSGLSYVVVNTDKGEQCLSLR